LNRCGSSPILLSRPRVPSVARMATRGRDEGRGKPPAKGRPKPGNCLWFGVPEPSAEPERACWAERRRPAKFSPALETSKRNGGKARLFFHRRPRRKPVSIRSAGREFNRWPYPPPCSLREKRVSFFLRGSPSNGRGGPDKRTESWHHQRVVIACSQSWILFVGKASPSGPLANSFDDVLKNHTPGAAGARNGLTLFGGSPLINLQTGRRAV